MVLQSVLSLSCPNLEDIVADGKLLANMLSYVQFSLAKTPDGNIKSFW
jgi:hypothetical protein